MSGDFTDGPLTQLELQAYQDRMQVGTCHQYVEASPFSKYDSPMALEAPSVPAQKTIEAIVAPVIPQKLVTLQEVEAFRQGYAFGLVLGAVGYVRGLFGKAFKRH
ncbi:hypothetical protein HY492_01420 [Candidatus Woesearchaeota archaeon]|nr:hypothetical protein [Candidatus Woesearchaeota archaeon]